MDAQGMVLGKDAWIRETPPEAVTTRESDMAGVKSTVHGTDGWSSSVLRQGGRHPWVGPDSQFLV